MTPHDARSWREYKELREEVIPQYPLGALCRALAERVRGDRFQTPESIKFAEAAEEFAKVLGW